VSPPSPRRLASSVVLFAPSPSHPAPIVPEHQLPERTRNASYHQRVEASLLGGINSGRCHDARGGNHRPARPVHWRPTLEAPNHSFSDPPDSSACEVLSQHGNRSARVPQTVHIDLTAHSTLDRVERRDLGNLDLE